MLVVNDEHVSTDVSNVFLIFGACRSRPDLLPSIPSYLRKHYDFISLRYPDIAPKLQKTPPSATNQTPDGSVDESSGSSLADMLVAITGKFEVAATSSRRSPLHVIRAYFKSVLADLEALAPDDPGRRNKYSILATHVRMCHSILKVSFLLRTL
jgi:hypothetical protein